MGQQASQLPWCRRRRAARALMLGLNGSGKTSLLYRALTGGAVTTIPTIGFNVESVDAGDARRLTVWDIGGRDKIRPLYRHYWPNTRAIFFVVDSTSDDEQLEEAAEELRLPMSAEELAGVPVAVLCNKCDRSGEAASPERLLKFFESRLGAERQSFDSRPTRFFATSAVTGEGVAEAFEWLAEKADEKEEEKRAGWCSLPAAACRLLLR